MYKKDEEFKEKIIERLSAGIAFTIFFGTVVFLYSIYSPEKTYQKVLYWMFIAVSGLGNTMLSMVWLSDLHSDIAAVINSIRQFLYVWKFNYKYKNVKLSFGKNKETFGKKYVNAYIQTEDELLELIINKTNKESLMNISKKYNIKIHHLELIFVNAESTSSIKSNITFEEYEEMQEVLKKYNEKYKHLGVQFDYKLSDSRYCTFICINSIDKSIFLDLDGYNSGFYRSDFNPQAIKPILFNFKIKEEDFMEIAKHSIFNQRERLERWNRDYTNYYNRGGRA